MSEIKFDVADAMMDSPSYERGSWVGCRYWLVDTKGAQVNPIPEEMLRRLGAYAFPRNIVTEALGAAKFSTYVAGFGRKMPDQTYGLGDRHYRTLKFEDWRQNGARIDTAILEVLEAAWPGGLADGYEWRWTADGRLLRVVDDRVVACAMCKRPTNQDKKGSPDA